MDSEKQKPSSNDDGTLIVSHNKTVKDPLPTKDEPPIKDEVPAKPVISDPKLDKIREEIAHAEDNPPPAPPPSRVRIEPDLADSEPAPNYQETPNIDSPENSVRVEGPYVEQYDESNDEELATEAAPGNRKRKILIGLVIGLVLITLLTFLASNKQHLRRISLVNGGYNYSFIYYANPVASKTAQYTQVTNNAISAVMAPSSYKVNCLKEFPKSVISPFSVDIQGQSYPVCSSNGNKSVFSFFEYNNTWQEALLFSSNGTTKVSDSFAKQVIESVKISK